VIRLSSPVCLINKELKASPKKFEILLNHIYSLATDRHGFSQIFFVRWIGIQSQEIFVIMLISGFRICVDPCQSVARKVRDNLLEKRYKDSNNIRSILVNIIRCTRQRKIFFPNGLPQTTKAANAFEHICGFCFIIWTLNVMKLRLYLSFRRNLFWLLSGLCAQIYLPLQQDSFRMTRRGV